MDERQNMLQSRQWKHLVQLFQMDTFIIVYNHYHHIISILHLILTKRYFFPHAFYVCVQINLQ